MMIHKIISIAAWMVLIVLVAATLSPIELRPQSGLPVNLERGAAYIILSGLLGLAYPRYFPWVGLGLIGLIVGLEFAQILLPDRHGQLTDAVVKVVGALIGMTLGAWGSRLISKRDRR